MKSIYIIVSVTVLTVAALLIFRGNDPREVNSPEIEPSKRKSRPSQFEAIADETIPWRERVKRIRSADTQKMSKSDIEKLYKLLDNEASHKSKEGWYAVVNGIMGKIVSKGILPEKISHTLISILEDSSRDSVIRDYAAQHLGNWITPQGAQSAYEKDPEKVSASVKALAKAVLDPENSENSIAGTALMVMVYTQKSGVSLDVVETELQDWLKNQLNTKSSSLLRGDAINAIGMLGQSSHLPALRKIAINPNESVSHRMTSISSIGLLGNDQDVSMLEKVAANDSRLKYAAVSALKKLTQLRSK